MDRVNRRFLVASTLLAIPAALLMVSLSNGTSPPVQQAIGQVSEESQVQQVVGKQLETRKTRPGLFQVLSGSQSRGNQNHKHQNMPSNEPKGLLDGFFDSAKKKSSSQSSSRNTSNAKRSTRTSSNASKSSNQLRSTAQANDDVNWEGIPFHSVGKSKTAQRKISAPVRDSNATASSTRIIRGGSTRRIQASPASVRKPAPSLPQPPRDPQLATTPTTSTAAPQLSSNSSSRRSTRRPVGALDPSEVAAAAPKKNVVTNRVAPTGDEPDLVPRVIRRKDLETQAKAKVAAKPTPAPKAAPKPAAKPAAAPTPTAAVAVKPQPAAKPTPAPAPAPAATPAPASTPTAVASIQPPAVAPQSPSAMLSAPTARATQAPTQQPAYTLPVDPANTPVPVAGVPSHPYAASTPPSASTPAMSVSHRAGPPSAAFQTTPPAPSAFNATSKPVGSGIMPNSDVASYRRPTQVTQPQIAVPAAQPSYQVAQRPGVDPYANSRPMTNYTRPNNNTRPAHETAAVPMRPIGGFASPARAPAPAPVPATRHMQSQPMADSFDRAAFGNRNQMRDAAPKSMGASASELPGIRVATFGPESIMIRQDSRYEIRIENRGSIDADGVMVRALVPDWADLLGQEVSIGTVEGEKQGASDRLVWRIEHLPAGATERMFVRLVAARSGTYDLDVDWTLMPQKSVARVQVREPRLDVTIEGPDEVVYGQSQTYKVRVLNPGDGIAPNVMFTLSPNSATPQTQRIGDIPPGKEAQFDVELTAQDLGDLKIHGLAAGDLELRAESQKTIRVSAAKLEAVLSGPELKYQNTPAAYTLQIQNTGQATSENVIATLRLPAGIEYLGGIEQATMQGRALRWEINALAPGATRDYKFGCNMTTTGDHQLVFDCKGSAAGNAEVAIATRVESISDLVLTVSDPIAPAPIGTNVTYEITIRNRGSKEATDIRAVAQFSHGIEPQRVEGQSGEVVTGQVLFDEIPRIGPGQEVTLRVIAQAERAGHHRFRTEVRSGDTVLVAEEATHYMSPKSERVSRRSTDSSVR